MALSLEFKPCQWPFEFSRGASAHGELRYEKFASRQRLHEFAGEDGGESV